MVTLCSLLWICVHSGFPDSALLVLRRFCFSSVSLVILSSSCVPKFTLVLLYPSRLLQPWVMLRVRQSFWQTVCCCRFLHTLMTLWRLEFHFGGPWKLLVVLSTPFMVLRGKSLPWEGFAGDDTTFIILTVVWWYWCCSSTQVLEHHSGLFSGSGNVLPFWVPTLMLTKCIWCWNFMVVSGSPC